MLRVWVHDCDPGRVWDGSRLALYQTLSSACVFCYRFFLFVVFVLFIVVFFLLSSELCR